MNITLEFGAQVSATDIVSHCVEHALNVRASDIHIETYEKYARLRMRVDGVLYDVASFDRAQSDAAIMRFKVLACMDITQRRLPQDGSYKIVVEDADHTVEIYLRLATYPSVHGESMAIRIHDAQIGLLALKELGLEKQKCVRLEAIVARQQGFILVSGATGSGKTTTLYALLKAALKHNMHIMTLEDPIEYVVPGVVQGQVDQNIGFSFVSGLRALVRHDPDMIMVGEIRDQQTAHIAIEAALTGHLVVASMHTGNAAEAIVRLLDMGIEPFLLADALSCVVGQSLVRKLCNHCKVRVPIKNVFINHLCAYGTLPDLVYEKRGCTECFNTGYHGRVGIFELLEPNQQVREAILHKAPLSHIIGCAESGGMDFLKQDLCAKVIEGIISPLELLA